MIKEQVSTGSGESSNDQAPYNKTKTNLESYKSIRLNNQPFEIKEHKVITIYNIPTEFIFQTLYLSDISLF